MTPDDPRHGTVAGRSAGCHCEPCKIAKRRYAKKLAYDHNQGRPRLVDATGSHRRIRALVALGWRYEDMGRLVGRGKNWAGNIVHETSITRANAETVDRVYQQLSMKLGPSELLRTKARNWGWQPPLAWDDETMDNPAAKPYSPEPYQRIRRRDDARPLEEIKAEREARRDEDRAAFVAEVELLLATDTVESTTRRLGYKRPDGVSSRLYDCGRHDLARIFEAVQKSQKKRDAAA